jgi:hypothetical protein
MLPVGGENRIGWVEDEYSELGGGVTASWDEREEEEVNEKPIGESCDFWVNDGEPGGTFSSEETRGEDCLGWVSSFDTDFPREPLGLPEGPECGVLGREAFGIRSIRARF